MKRFVFPREVLLVEVERRCGELLCGARMKLSLTKEDARAYTGFECERCGRWYADALSEREIPEWWEELNVASLRGLKPARVKPKGEGPKQMHGSARESKGAMRTLLPSPKEVSKTKPAPRLPRAVEENDTDESEVVARMSREWRRLGGERESAPEDAEVERGDSF